MDTENEYIILFFKESWLLQSVQSKSKVGIFEAFVGFFASPYYEIVAAHFKICSN